MTFRLVVPFLVLSSVVPAWAQEPMGPPTPYRLTSETTFQEGCFAPCLCPILLLPLEGKFLLEPEGFDGLFWNFDVRNVNWRGRDEQGSLFHITGSGTYRFGGEFVSQHQLTLDLQVGDDAVQHFDSGLVIGGGNFPVIDIVISVGGMVCYDRAIDLHARPAPHLWVSSETVQWDPAVGVMGFDVVWGDLDALRVSGGDFSQAVDWCLVDDTPDTSHPFDADPEPGRAFWFVLRYAHESGVESYDSDSLAQTGSRDPGIESSPASCP